MSSRECVIKSDVLRVIFAVECVIKSEVLRVIFPVSRCFLAGHFAHVDKQSLSCVEG